MNQRCFNQRMVWGLSLLALAVWLQPGRAAEAVTSRANIDFNHDIRPILSENCFACHGPDEEKRKGRLRLDVRDGAIQPAKSGAIAIVPGNVEKSELISRVTNQDEDERMPPLKTGKKLTNAQIDLIRHWIQDGAEYKAHRFFVPPERSPAPTVKATSWPRNPIDQFILARLEAEGHQPMPEADSRTLVRRLKLDLIGLPPTPAEVDQFLADKSPGAYERLVDRFLASPHYGERMAVEWLDAARFADTHGYHIDSGRDMTLWREWVINAYNSNKPFDQFTIEQLAGDLLPNATREQKLASGFNRNHMINFEGGAIPEEYHAAYLMDRVNTTTKVWLGLTVACAQCHDHKYDPITQKDYYRFYAFFNNVPENGLDGQKGNAVPVLQFPTPEMETKLARLKANVVATEAKVKELETDLPALQAALEKEWHDAPADISARGLVAQFTFDETLSCVDSSGTISAGTFHSTNTPAWASGKTGKALKLEGAGWVESYTNSAFEPADGLSWGGWANLNGERGALLSKMEDAPSLRGFDLLLADGKLLVHLINHWPDNGLRVQTKEKVPSDSWFHAFATYDGSGKAAGVKIYVDGESQPLETLDDKLTGDITNGVALHIGARFNSDFLKGSLDDVRLYNRVLSEAEIEHLVSEPTRQMAAIPPEMRSADQKAEIAAYVRRYRDPDLRTADKELKRQRDEAKEFEHSIPTAMVMQEMDKPRDTFLLERGQYDKPGEKVTPAIPAAFGALPESAPANRLGLARWLVATNNPLTARVIVNRYWQMYFGTGLVKTAEDFGTQGEWPSHPELLDWLATEFMSSGWDVKAMQKLIVSSATYRQSSVTTADLSQHDPENRLLAHGPRLRLQAEFIRDQALAISGLLNDKIGGSSVSPYQPSGLWEELASREDGKNWTAQTYTQSHGSDLYRRTMYTFWKRSSPPPTLSTFDAPDRETCTVRRQRTNTPLQALILMNDPTYIEASRRLAQRLLTEAHSDPERITMAFQLALSRPPAEKELAVLSRIHKQQIAAYQANPVDAARLLSAGESSRNESIDPAELAAWTIVANIILNLDETITKG